MTEQEILKFLSEAETGALTDGMKLLHMDGWMEGILPASEGLRICGRAFTVQYERRPAAEEPSLNVFEMMEQPDKGCILVCSVPSKDAIVGENIMHATQVNGLNGMVLDGKARDYGVIRRDKLPLFSKGPAIRLETECKITKVQIPVLCGGILVQPDDYIVGDDDGVICIRADEVEKLIYQVEHIAEIEKELERTIQSGKGMSAVAAVSKQKKQLRP